MSGFRLIAIVLSLLMAAALLPERVSAADATAGASVPHQTRLLANLAAPGPVDDFLKRFRGAVPARSCPAGQYACNCYGSRTACCNNGNYCKCNGSLPWCSKYP